MTHPSISYPALKKSYKGLFPFKIGTTSFIYPDHYIPNVKMLGPYLDEIELLLFESRTPDALPPRPVIDELAGLADEYDLSYNIHLPTDISLSDPNPVEQRLAVETVQQVIELVNPLVPSILTLHVPYDEVSLEAHHVEIWRDRVCTNLEKIRSSNNRRHRITVETLDYPFEIMENIITDLEFSICLDLGHLMVYEYDIVEVFNKYASQTPIIHLHGIEDHDDHKALDRLPEKFAESVLWILKRFTGIVSLEIFSYEDLAKSLNYLEKMIGTDLSR
jgi:sugar phosphate isomerase/epimerase